jgi:hypothetical protein
MPLLTHPHYITFHFSHTHLISFVPLGISITYLAIPSLTHITGAPRFLHLTVYVCLSNKLHNLPHFSSYGLARHTCSSHFLPSALSSTNPQVARLHGSPAQRIMLDSSFLQNNRQSHNLVRRVSNDHLVL